MIGTLLLPFHVLIIPQYILFNRLDLIDTFVPLLLPKFLATEAFFVFLLVQFIRQMPRDMDEAARIDGAGHFRIFWSIILPLIKPALITCSIFAFIWAWNDFLGPLLYLTSPENYPLPDRAAPLQRPDLHQRLRRHRHGILHRPPPGAAVLPRVPAVPGRRRRHAGPEGLSRWIVDSCARRSAPMRRAAAPRSRSGSLRRFPGVKGSFALFGEVLLTGLLVTVAGIAIITLPAALAAGIRHLRRYVNAEASHARLFWQDFVKALPGGLAGRARGPRAGAASWPSTSTSRTRASSPAVP